MIPGSELSCKFFAVRFPLITLFLYHFHVDFVYHFVHWYIAHCWERERELSLECPLLISSQPPLQLLSPIFHFLVFCSLNRLLCIVSFSLLIPYNLCSLACSLNSPFPMRIETFVIRVSERKRDAHGSTCYLSLSPLISLLPFAIHSHSPCLSLFLAPLISIHIPPLAHLISRVYRNRCSSFIDCAFVRRRTLLRLFLLGQACGC